jgi:hypothetical protein
VIKERQVDDKGWVTQGKPSLVMSDTPLSDMSLRSLKQVETWVQTRSWAGRVSRAEVLLVLEWLSDLYTAGYESDCASASL